MRISILDTYYASFLDEHYAARPGLAGAGHGEQMESLLSQCFGTGDAYSRHLREEGWDAAEIIGNCLPAHLAWVRENRRLGRAEAASRSVLARRPAARTRMLRQLSLEQIAAMEADVVYCQDLWFLSAPDLDRLRAEGRFVVGQTASEPPGKEILERYDLLLSSFPHYVERFRALGVDARYLRIAFNTAVLERLAQEGTPHAPDAERPHRVAFVGGVDPTVHPAGTALLERLAERVPLEVWGYGSERLHPSSPLRRCHRGQAWGLGMYRVLARSQIVVNRHIEAAEGYANNMRLYEATGLGAALLTEATPNLGDLFEPDVEVATYRDEEELVARIEHLAAHREERLAIASAGQRRTLRDHTYRERMRELSEILRDASDSR